MNYTKRITALILALLLLLGLTACGQDPSGNTEGSNTDGGEWVGAARCDGTFSDQGYYYIPENQSSNLHYLDIATGATTILCTKAGCTHKGDKCEAYSSNFYFGRGGACFWEGNLYFFDQTSAEPIKLVRCNATGTERQVIGLIGAKHIEQKKIIFTQNFARVGSFWYYCAEVLGSVWDEETQQWNNERELSYISRINLRTGKEEILFEEEEHDLDFYAAREDAVLFTVQEKHDVDNKDPDYREQLANIPISLKRWDGDTGQITTLFEKKSGEFTKIVGIYGDKAYYVARGNNSADEYNNLYTLDLSTGESELFIEQIGIAYWSGGFAKCIDSQSDKKWYILELESGKKLPIEVEEGGFIFDCGSDQGCILKWSVTPADGGPTEHRVSYVHHTALSDGLQEADLMQFYTWKNRVSGKAI